MGDHPLDHVRPLASILRRVERPKRYAGDWEANVATRQLDALAAAGFQVVPIPTEQSD